MNIRRNVLIIAFVVIAALFIYVMRNNTYQEMNDFKLLPRPELLTELYFDNYLALPKTTTANKPISFSFSVHNLEEATTTYPYKVYFEDASGSQTVFQSSSITLADNGTQSVSISYTPTASNLQGKIIVDLTSLNQTIDFLLPNTTQ